MFENGKKYFEQTRFGQSDFWIWVGGAALIIGGFIIGQMIAAFVLLGNMLAKDPESMDKLMTDPDAANQELMAMIGGSPVLYAVMLASFAVPLIITFFAVSKLHKRFYRTVLTAAEKFRWKRLFFAAALTLLIAGGFSAEVISINGSVTFCLINGSSLPSQAPCLHRFIWPTQKVNRAPIMGSLSI